MGKLLISGPLSIDSDAERLTMTIECDTGKVSDGYHTFDELYDHRCLLFLAWQATMMHAHLARLPSKGGELSSPAWKSRKHHDGSSFDGWFIAGLQLMGGQITYHIPDTLWDLCKGRELDRAPAWDGHTSQDVIDRLRLWLAATTG